MAVVLVTLPPPPPPVEAMDENTELEPFVPRDEMDVDPAPPAPIVMLYDVAVTASPVAVLYPPAPPPPEPLLFTVSAAPPPPPPATTKYSTTASDPSVVISNVPDELKVWTL